MGNRAVITTAPFNAKNVGIYLHWNGGRDSVEAFLKAAKELGYRDPTTDTEYGMARLIGLICLYFGHDSDTSIGVGRCDQLDCDNGDNGTYLIGPGWTIAGRKHFRGTEQQEYDVDAMAAGLVAGARRKSAEINV